MSPLVQLFRVRSGRRFVATLDVAETPSTRQHGLLGRDALEVGRGLLITRCNCVHTFFMRFAIDVAFLDSSNRVLKVAHGVRRSRLVWGGWRARSTVELAAGELRRHDVRPGDRFECSPLSR